MIKLTVPPDSADQRLDIWLTKAQPEIPDLSRSAIKRFIELGKVKVNGDIAKPGYSVRHGDQIDFDSSYIINELAVEAENINLNVVYEDSDILVINKPSGMVVHPGAGIKKGTLVNALLFRYGNSLPMPERTSSNRPGVVHRLDKETSGLLVIALNEKSHTVMANYFSDRKIKKRYRAILWGCVESGFMVDISLKRSPSNPLKIAANVNGRIAKTEFALIRSAPFAAVVYAYPETGRTHQIRVHAAYMRHPIAGDSLYGESRANRMKQIEPLYKAKAAKLADSAARVMLHAEYLSFNHPISDKKMEFFVEPPFDFNETERLVS